MNNKGKFFRNTLHMLIMCLFTISSLVAQTEKMAFEKYGVAEGLPEEFVSSMVQDDQGFMWFSTQNGLVKFDGYKLKVFRGTDNKQDSTNLQLNNLNGGILKGNDGKLWIGGILSNNSSLASFDPVTEKFKNYSITIKDSIGEQVLDGKLTFEDSEDNIWFSSSTKNNDTTVIGRLNIKTHTITTYPYKPINSRIFNDILLNFSLLEANIDKSIWLLDNANNLRVFNRKKDEFEIAIPIGSEIPGSGIKDTIQTITKGYKGSFLLTGNNSVFVWDPVKKESIHTYNKENLLSSNPINFAFEDLHGNHWVMHIGGMISIIDPVNNTSTKLTSGKGVLNFKDSKEDMQIYVPISQSLKGIWLQGLASTGTAAFLYYKFSTKSFAYYDGKFNDDSNPLPKNSGYIYQVVEDRTGLLWLGTRPNFYKQSPKSRQIDLFRHDKEENSTIPSDTIFGLFEDSKHRLWLGAPSGISVKLEDDSFKQYYFQDTKGKQKDFSGIRQIYEDSKGNIWVGTVENGLLRLNESKQEFQRIKFIKDVNNIRSIQEDVNNNLWVSADNIGVYILNGKTLKVIKKFEIDTKETHGLLSDRINSMFLDSRGTMWFGDGRQNEFGLFRYIEKDQKFKHYKRDDADSTAINSYEIRKIIEDDHNRMWVPTDDGVNLYDHEKDIFYKNTPTYDISSVNTVTKATNGKIWVATYASGGLALVGPGINDIVMYGEDKGLLHNDINTLVLDDYGKLWLPTERGLSVFDTLTKTYTSYFEKDGFQKYGNINAYQKTSDGNIWIGGRNGLNRINPNQLTKKDSIPPQVFITSMGILDSIYSKPDGKLFNKAVSYTEQVTLKYWQKNLSFNFVGIHFLRPEDNQYSWKLENYDDNWTIPSKERRAAYTNLSSGTYTFHVKASNADGVWNEEGATIKIIISPPWWLTWWAYVMYALIIGLIGLQIHKSQKEKTLRLARERAQEKELEQAKEIEKAYTELKSTQAQLIQSEKMASLGELTAGIAHEIQNPLNFVNNFAEVNSELIEEMKEELDNGNLDEVQSLANDINENEKKIMFHGKRADSIVKGMLQHSRISNGKQEPTDINALADEYFRLAYHGLRAKDKSFNATMVSNFDDSVGKVDIIPQDIGRVILNLITNAFYVVDEKKKSGIKNYEPTVTVSTKKGSKHVEIQVTDNGNGIPENIVSKIFEPFFTTKPTGKGTGLGLSMSYDIITNSHGGELKVETKEGKGTTFNIKLPNV